MGLTGAVGFTKLKDISTGCIPQSDAEPALSDAMDEVEFAHFLDDDFGGAPTFDRMCMFLHEWYFPRLVWARLTISPKKSRFFAAELRILGHGMDAKGIRPSSDKLAALRNWPTPTCVEDVEHFLRVTSFTKNSCPGGSDLTCILRTAVQVEIKLINQGNRRKRRKKHLSFVWEDKHQKALRN